MEIIGYTLFREARSRAPLARYNCDTDAIQDTLSLSAKARYATFPRKFTRSTSAHARISAMLPFFALSGAPHAGKPLKNSSNKNENVTRKGARKSRLQTQKKKKKKKKEPERPAAQLHSSSPLPPPPPACILLLCGIVLKRRRRLSQRSNSSANVSCLNKIRAECDTKK